MSKLKKTISIVIKTYLLTWILIVLWFFIRAFTESISFRQSFEQLFELLTYRDFVIFIHVFFLIIFVLVLVTKYFRNVFKNKGMKIMLKRIFFRFITPILLIYFGGSYLLKANAIDSYQYNWILSYENNSQTVNNHYIEDNKFRGMSVFGWHRSNGKDIDELVKNNIEWVAVIPFFYQKDEQTKK